MRNKIVTVTLGDELYVKAEHVFQYDYGLELVLDGIQLPAEYEVHFSNKKHGVAKKGEPSENGVKIPDEYLRTGQDVFAWVYLRNGDDDGYTVYSIQIPVVGRSVEQGDNISVVEHNIIDKAIEALNEAVEKTEENVRHYPIISDEHTWMLYDADAGEYVDTGIVAEGEDGFSPECQITEIQDGHRVVFTDINGSHSFDVMDGVIPGGAIPSTEKGAANGVAELDSSGKVPSSQLPSYVDDVLEFANVSSFPAVGETGKIYVARNTNETYRWTGSSYIVIGSSLALGETSSTAYRGDRGRDAYEHAVLNKGNAFNIGLYKIETNTEGHVVSAEQVTSDDLQDLGLSNKADKADTVLDTTLSRGRKANTNVGTGSFAFGDNVEATANYSHAEGNASSATGSYAHAEGSGTVASGNSSHAEGGSSVASGGESHAEGDKSKAIGDYSHAEGELTKAEGYASHAEGSNTKATNDYGHAEGSRTTASGLNSHAEGYSNTSSGNSSHAEGGNTQATGDYSHAEGYESEATAYASHAEGGYTEASGTYSHAEGEQTKATNSYAHAEGHFAIASGLYSHAEGYAAIASASASHAEGSNTATSGINSHAEGMNTRAMGDQSHAEGERSSNMDTRTIGNVNYRYGAYGEASHAEGRDTIAGGNISHAEGSGTAAIEYSAHAEGAGTIASGMQSHAEGGGTTASGSQAHAEGGGTQATGSNTHAEGSGTQAINSSSHAEGSATTASGFASHSEGNGTKAVGDLSHAEGANTIANGAVAHAEGYNTKAAGAYSHVNGKYNVEDNRYLSWPEWTANTQYAVGDTVKITPSSAVEPTKGYICKTANSDSTFTSSKWDLDEGVMTYATITGNGTGDANRSNAYALDWNGTGHFAGDVYVGCNPDSTGGTKLATMSDIPDVATIAETQAIIDAYDDDEEDEG